ncbi:(d)CMP kinase [Nocardioides sp. GY 10127]|uniref:(d)CMP kinase n=1 Tax=Nocardioides sp. GY 10127 TaxID=2569762 RepID=UPI001F0FFE0E|nr:(d)CMP kinase [Nocardioides sp. GY 10127]
MALDGPSGSGKTTLSRALAAQAEAAGLACRQVHMDDLYEGWSGLPHVRTQLATLLRPLTEGRAGVYRRWDWFESAWAEDVEVPPTDLLVLEGVGSGVRATAPLLTLLAWLDAPVEERHARGLARDGETFEPWWDTWAGHEAALYAEEGTRGRADVLVDGTGATPPVLVGGAAEG